MVELERNPNWIKLDMIIVSTDWEITYPLRRVMILIRLTSDHVSLGLNKCREKIRWLTERDKNTIYIF